MQPQGSPRLGNTTPSPANTPGPSNTSTSNGMSLSNGLQVATDGNGRPAEGYSVNRYSSALAAVEADEAANSGWGNEDDDLFADEGFEPMEQLEPVAPSPMRSTTSTRPTTSRPSTSANSAMTLGGASKPSSRLGFGATDDGAGKKEQLVKDIVTH